MQHDTTRCISESGVDPSQVAGIGVDGIGWTLLPVMPRASRCIPAMIWLDRRAEEEAKWLRALAQANDWLMLRCQTRSTPRISRPKMLWLKKHQPDVFGPPTNS